MTSEINRKVNAVDTTEQDLARKSLWQLFLYVIFVSIVSSVLLVINVGMVYSIYTEAAQYIPENLSQQIGQLVLLVFPFAILFLEWYLYDLLIGPFRRWK